MKCYFYPAINKANYAMLFSSKATYYIKMKVEGTNVGKEKVKKVAQKIYFLPIGHHSRLHIIFNTFPIIESLIKGVNFTHKKK